MRSIATLLLLSLTIRADAGDWPQWLGPNRDGTTTEVVKPWTEKPKVLWRANVGEGHSSPVVADGHVYLPYKKDGANEELLIVYDAASGKQLRELGHVRKPFESIFGVGPRATPVVTSDGQIISLGVTGVLEVNGKQLSWKDFTLDKFHAPNLRFGVSASPLVLDDRVIVLVGGPGAGLVAYNRKDGAVIWKSLDDKASYASPILIEQAGRKLVVALTANGVVAVDAGNGELVWRHPFKDLLAESSTTPVKVGDSVIASSVTLGSVALKLTTKDGKPAVEQAWKNPQLSCYFSTPAVVGEHLYMVTGSIVPPPSVTLHCVEAATGKVLWSQKNIGKYHAALLRTGDDKLLLHSDSGDLALIDPNPKEYRELSRSSICGSTWAHPALSNGKLYVRDAKELIALQLAP